MRAAAGRGGPHACQVCVQQWGMLWYTCDACGGNSTQLTWQLLPFTYIAGTDRQTQQAPLTPVLLASGASLCSAAACRNLCMLLELLRSFATCWRMDFPPHTILTLVDDCLPKNFSYLQVKHLYQAKRSRLPCPQKTQGSALRGDWRWSCSASACRQVSS